MSPTSVPESIKHRYKNWCRKEQGKPWKLLFFRRGRTFILSAEHYTVVQKQGPRGFVRSECANRKVIKKPSEMKPKSITKSMNNQCRIHARRSDAKKRENQKNWSPKGSRKPSQIAEQINATKWYKKKTLPGKPGGPLVPGDIQINRIKYYVYKKGRRKVRSLAEDANTPWAPSGPKRISNQSKCQRQSSARGLGR